MLERFGDGLLALGCAGKKILVAVSGGLDSTVLLDLLLKSKCDVAVAHANFQLRGEASMGDEAWVSQLAIRQKIPYYVHRFETNNYATKNGVSTQMAARELRYAWFKELMEQEGYEFLATGHHLNDNLETFLLNFVRGSGLGGLKGIPIKNGRIIRPLLTFSRKEIEEYAVFNQLTWCEDASNERDDYNRNFVRHQVVPKLKVLNPSLEETFKRNDERLGAADELMHLALDHLRQTHVLQQGIQLKILKSLFDLFINPAAVLLELIKEYGFNLDQCREVVLAATGQPGKQFLSPTHHLVVDREHVIVIAHQSAWGEIQIKAGQQRAELGPWFLEMKNHGMAEVLLDKYQAILAKDKLRFPLLWRKWKPGDFFFPLGMEHKKKISDFLVDTKVSLADKESVTVLESGGEIAWVVGHRIDNRFRILETSQSGLLFHLTTRV